MAGKQITEAEVQQARQRLLEARGKLNAGTAVTADHRRALEAMLLLPVAEAHGWLEEFRHRFAGVPRERTRQAETRPSRSVRPGRPATAPARKEE